MKKIALVVGMLRSVVSRKKEGVCLDEYPCTILVTEVKDDLIMTHHQCNGGSMKFGTGEYLDVHTLICEKCGHVIMLGGFGNKKPEFLQYVYQAIKSRETKVNVKSKTWLGGADEWANNRPIVGYTTSGYAIVAV